MGRIPHDQTFRLDRPLVGSHNTNLLALIDPNRKPPNQTKCRNTHRTMMRAVVIHCLGGQKSNRSLNATTQGTPRRSSGHHPVTATIRMLTRSRLKYSVCFEAKYREADGAVLEDWLSQMMVGYKASHPLSSFEAQLRLYKSKIGKAEEDLRVMVFYGDRSP